MQKLNKIKWLLFVTSLWLLTSCTTKPPDVTVFENLQQHLVTDPVTGHLLLVPSPTCMNGTKDKNGKVLLKGIGEPECGHGVSVVTGVEILVGELTTFKGKKWSELKAESVYCPAVECYAPVATYTINSCAKLHCSDDVDAYRVKLDSLNGVSGALKNP